MNVGVISVRYARALIKSADTAQAKDKVYADMQTLAANYLEVRQLRPAVNNPMLPKADKEKILLAACGGKPCGHTKTFIKVVLKEGREDLMQFMANSYVTLYRREKNIISGRLITAVAVDKPTEDKMRVMVEKRADAKVEFRTEVNPDIIGGFILEYDTYRMDASVKSQLHTILKELS